MANSNVDILVEALASSPKLASLVINCQMAKLESASSEAVRRLREQVGTNVFKQPASNIHEVAAEADIDVGGNPVDDAVAAAFREGSVPDLMTDESREAMYADDDVELEPEVDVADDEGIVDNPSDDKIDEFCSLLAGDEI